jgi:hypothetical protein
MSPGKPTDDEPPRTVFEFERRRRKLEPGEQASDDISQLPPLPASSPWGAGPGPGDEPLIDRREDADTTGVPIDQQ